MTRAVACAIAVAIVSVSKTSRNAVVWFLVPLLLSISMGCAQPGTLIETWEPPSEGVKVRVRKLDEWSVVGIPMHTYFILDAVDPTTGRWQEVMTWRLKGPANISRDNVRVLSKLVAFAFCNSRFVVTTDGGTTWHGWAARENGPVGIVAAEIADGGAGTMQAMSGASEAVQLKTTDYGLHWSLQPSAVQR